LNIGVLGLQGSVIEHANALNKLDQVNPVIVRTKSDLDNVSGLILPGGESTVIAKLLGDSGLNEHIIERAKKGMPIWGTCAGMILMAKNIVNEIDSHLGLMNISVVRNAYGSQLDSFKTELKIPKVSENEIQLVFIRAPWVESIGENVEVLAWVNNKVVAVKQNNLIATSFHPELTDNLDFHKYFLNEVKKQNSY